MTPKEIKAARLAAGLTQLQAAALIHCGETTWQGWELGTRKMHPAFWELFQVKSDPLGIIACEALRWDEDEMTPTAMHAVRILQEHGLL